MMQQLVQSPMALAAMIVCMTHICIASKSLQCHLRWAATREYKDWTPRAAARVGLHGKFGQRPPTEEQPPVAGPTQASPKSPAEAAAAADVPVVPAPPVMPSPPIFSPPMMPPPPPLGEMAPMPIMMMMPQQAVPAAGMCTPMLTMPEPVQPRVVPALLPKASSSAAGMVELAIGVTNQIHGLHALVAQMYYQNMYRPQAVPQPTPPPRVENPPTCIPNCVGYSQ